ncbi:uncharacterized protein LOC116844476 [Odontomachus brunneus]|uniref:uncharacterized protein LOC116844476 n=1 Tax=Odontomachus brunneus TaxID=486640 RepID=UPI0013F1D308|nr:uncharacterized protein LOC116844476 [Odontomachus brunneus]
MFFLGTSRRDKDGKKRCTTNKGNPRRSIIPVLCGDRSFARLFRDLATFQDSVVESKSEKRKKSVSRHRQSARSMSTMVVYFRLTKPSLIIRSRAQARVASNPR